VALDETIVASVANSNFKSMSEATTILANTLSQDIIMNARLSNQAAIQTSNDARNVATSALGVLMKRTCELDITEAAAGFSTHAHTNRLSATSAAGADSAQVSQSILQLSNSQQAIQVQLAQLVTLLATQQTK
jgi:hypothetical protein